MPEIDRGTEVVQKALLQTTPGHRFEIVAEQEIDASPEVVFDAVTTGVAGWLWPTEIEPRLGGAGPFGSTVVAWDPPHRYRNHVDGENGFFNTLDFQIEARAEGRAWLRYVHSGVLFEDWDGQYDGARQHTDFYQHTLAQYVTHFPGRSAAFAEVRGPAGSGSAGAFDVLRDALGIPPEVAEESSVTLATPGFPQMPGVVDYNRPHFIGVRTEGALYRVFGRNAFGDVVALTIHAFDDRDTTKEAAAWTSWLEELYR